MASEFVDASTDAPGKISDPVAYASGTNAHKASKAHADRIGRIGRTLEIIMPGTLDVIAGAILTVQGFRPGIDGEWLIKSVRQQINRQGWTTQIECEGITADETYRKPPKTRTKAKTAADT